MFVGASAFGQMGADNSKVNERDSSREEVTADKQKSNMPDMRLTARIRRDIVGEKNFSTYAKNIKIIAINGKVTVKGPVRSAAEEKGILKFAKAAAGPSNVVNEIAVTPEK